MAVTHLVPQTDDGWLSEVQRQNDDSLLVQIVFNAKDPFLERISNKRESVSFATRSRIARLGIDIRGVGPVQFSGNQACLKASIRAMLKRYGVGQHLERIMLPGLRVGRLVFRDPERRLTADEVYQAILAQEVQLPAPLSIDIHGRIGIQPHRCIYDLRQPISSERLLAVIAGHDGKRILNRMQIRRDVDNILLEPGDAIITSCTMFLHKHFAVLDAESSTKGQHMNSTFLDPGITRSARIFLEFLNSSQVRIINPSVEANIYEADSAEMKHKKWFGASPKRGSRSKEVANDEHSKISSLFKRSIGRRRETRSYMRRPMAVISSLESGVQGERPLAIWPGPGADELTAIEAAVARLSGPGFARPHYYSIPILEELDDGADATILVEYFPNMVEHLQICTAAAKKKIDTLVFRRASFEHGPFLSAHDHGRLADYHSLGLEVMWCNDVFEHVGVHIYRGLRGYFAPVGFTEEFKNLLIVGFYGSTIPLIGSDASNLGALIGQFRDFFGDNLAFLTGGGPGAMQQATDIAVSMGLSVGCNFLENADQHFPKKIGFYQTFQEDARHHRQRWFEISSFHIFCIGGLGTIEEMGLTLTDMKLGLIDVGPLVFFGKRGAAPYWDHFRKQLDTIACEKRGPGWLKTNILTTDDPAEVIDFYRRVLEVSG